MSYYPSNKKQWTLVPKQTYFPSAHPLTYSLVGDFEI